MDRHGTGTRSCSTHADRDSDHHLRANRDGDALDSNPNPKLDPVDRHGHHHEYSHLYLYIDTHRDGDPFADPVPTRDRDVYVNFNFHGNCHFYPNANSNVLRHTYHYHHVDAIPYILPNNSRCPITL